MSKLHKPHGRTEADTAKGELRKPDDYSNQPGQGGAYRGDGGGEAEPSDPAARNPAAMPPRVGESPREYGHGSGDRNTMDGPRDRHGFQGGTQRDAVPGAPADAKAQRRPRQDTAERAGDEP